MFQVRFMLSRPSPGREIVGRAVQDIESLYGKRDGAVSLVGASEVLLPRFGRAGEHERSTSVLQRLLFALYWINIAHILSGGVYGIDVYPVRYRAEPIGQEFWKDVQRIIEDGEGDCEDLGSAQSAEEESAVLFTLPPHLLRAYLRDMLAGTVRPLRSWPTQRSRKKGKLIVYHITVERVDGTTDDPSLRKGMPSGGALLEGA